MQDKLPLKISNKNFRGQALIEAIVAISVAMMGILGVLSLVSKSLGANSIAADRYIAVNLAAEGIEVVKNLIDHSVLKALKKGGAWNKGIGDGIYQIDYNYDSTQFAAHRIATDLTGCKVDSIRTNTNINFLILDKDTGFYGSDSFGEETNYKRIVCVENLLDGNEIKVNSIVTWISRGNIESDINLEDHFYNWALRSNRE